MNNTKKNKEREYNEELAEARIERAIERYNTAVEKPTPPNHQKSEKEKQE